MEKVALFRDPLFKKHENSKGHPESPSRLKALDDMISSHPLKSNFLELQSRDAEEQDILRVHSIEHFERVKDSSRRDQTFFDYDTGANKFSYNTAMRAAGAAVSAVDTVVEGPCRQAFAMVRPPGHHAERDQVMGFCLFNNAAVAAEYARFRFGFSRIFIFDWDVHHGNGTMHSFYGEPEVLYSSIHQFPHYPGTGTAADIGSGDGKGYTVNLPMQPGAGDADYRLAMDRIVIPIIEEYRPELILISAGSDAHADDPLSEIRLSSAMFADMTALFRNAAALVCDGRIVLLLEGGYNLDSLADSCGRSLDALCGAHDLRPTADSRDPQAAKLISRVAELQGKYWRGIGQS